MHSVVLAMTNESLFLTDCNNLKASTDSLDSAEDFKPVEINLGEIREVYIIHYYHDLFDIKII